jgi:excisionase family DNA binding protein
MQTFSAHVEVDDRAPVPSDGNRLDVLIKALTPYGGVPGVSPRGFRSATITLPAENIAQACATAAAVVSSVYGGATPIVVEAMTAEEFTRRDGWVDPPSELISVTEAADILHTSRQAVLEGIRRKSLPAERVGHTYVLPRDAVVAKAAQRADGERLPRQPLLRRDIPRPETS